MVCSSSCHERRTTKVCCWRKESRKDKRKTSKSGLMFNHESQETKRSWITCTTPLNLLPLLLFSNFVTTKVITHSLSLILTWTWISGVSSVSWFTLANKVPGEVTTLGIICTESSQCWFFAFIDVCEGERKKKERRDEKVMKCKIPGDGHLFNSNIHKNHRLPEIYMTTGNIKNMQLRWWRHWESERGLQSRKGWGDKEIIGEEEENEWICFFSLFGWRRRINLKNVYLYLWLKTSDCEKRDVQMFLQRIFLLLFSPVVFLLHSHLYIDLSFNEFPLSIRDKELLSGKLKERVSDWQWRKITIIITIFLSFLWWNRNLNSWGNR